MSEQLYRWSNQSNGAWVDTEDMRQELIEDGVLVPVERSETIIEIVNERTVLSSGIDLGPGYPPLKVRHSCPDLEEGLYRLVEVSDE